MKLLILELYETMGWLTYMTAPQTAKPRVDPRFRAKLVVD